MATMLVDNLVRELVVLIEQTMPALVTHLGGASRGFHDIGEQNSREHPLRLGCAVIAMAGNEFFDITELIFWITGPETVVAGRVFDVLYARNCCRELTAEFDRDLKIGRTVEYQRRHMKRRKNCGDIDLAV